mgnify:CR=1 FL=1
MARVKTVCVDAGSEFCPCYLAELNECITCSHLQGKGFCDCGNIGICIYQEYIWCGSKKKATRGVFPAKILEKHPLSKKAVLLKLKVSKKLARQLNEPGAFVFLREKHMPHYFDAPMSIMNSSEEGGVILIAIQIRGIKTKTLKNVGNEVLLKGPYWNGILGKAFLKQVAGENCLVVAKGISQAPAVLVVNKLIKNNNNVEIILDKGNLGKIFVDGYLDRERCSIVSLDLMSSSGREYLEQKLSDRNLRLVFSAGPDKLHLEILEKLAVLNPEVLLAVTNNTPMVCGEGVCGSCSVVLENGLQIRACKTQVDVRKAMERRVLRD